MVIPLNGFETFAMAGSQVPNCSIWSAGTRALLTALIFFAAAILAGCVTSDPQGGLRPASTDVLAQVREIDLSAHSPARVRTADTAPDRGPQAQSYYGDGGSAIAEPKPEDPLTTGALPTGADANPSNQGYELNFENAPIPTVAKTILGDILGVGYAIDPRVQGTVSLSSGRPVPKKDILFVLESALRVSNVALVREAGGYRLIPAAEAAGTGSIEGASNLEAGYGVTVVPLQFVSAQTLTKLIDSFATKAGTVRADASRNLVVIQGSAADRRAAIDTVMSFDADWMRGQSVGIYPVTNSTPEPLIGELEKIIDAGEGGLSQNLVKLQPVARQNAVLVVTRRPELLKTVSTWITRLDKSGTAGTGVKVYRMRYGDARQVAELLNEMFTGVSSSAGDTPSNQLVPGGGAVASSSNRPNLGLASQNGGAQQPGALGPSQPQSGGPNSFDARFGQAAGARFAQNGPIAPSTFNPGAGASPGGASPILPGVRIAADAVNNAVLVYGNQENYRIIERTLQQLDRPQLQVAIDATIAEVTLNDTLNYGVQFFLKSSNLGLPPNSGSIVNTTSDADAVAAAGSLLSRALPGFNFLAGTEAQPQVILNALHAVTDVKVLSNPSLVVVDNQFATLQVGDQIPVSTGTATVLSANNTVVNTVDYRNTGVILRVAPRINANGNVLLDIEQEISSVADNANATTLTPTVSQRKVASSIAVASGQTVLLAGLMSQTQNHGRSGIPVLDQVPGFGALFSSTTGTAHRTELIIFIRPQIIRNGVDARRIAEELRSKMKGQFIGEARRPCCIK
jgi:general secretion pathway protein D